MAARHTNGAAIKAFRAAYGLTQKDMAAALDISAPYLSNIEAGRKPDLPLGLTRRIADHLGVPLAAITYPAPTREDDALLAASGAER